MPKNKLQKNLGFTLIELLVVISIIGFLATASMVAFNNARMKARDAKRRSDLKQMQSAVEIYYNSNNSYPSTGGSWWGECPAYGSHAYSGANGYIPNLAPTYMAMLPKDPKWVGTGGCYLYRSNGADYMILTHQTIESFDPDVGPDPMDRPCCNQQTIAVYSPGAKNW
ncbi:MAG: prepilin-type N-terminal cleavage/methylation domain-containing protein [bacterium]